MSATQGSEPEKPMLPVHEWLAIVIMAACLVTLGLITLVSDPEMPPEGKIPQVVYNRNIEIHIEGAVKNPGNYKVEPGTLLKDVLALAEPAEMADLRGIKLEKKLKKGMTIKVPTIPMITIYLEGAVEKSGPLVIPKGSKVQDLIPLISLKDGADQRKLERKRKLKDQEIIVVPLLDRVLY